jgi:Tol biopolymer transport system component
MRRLVVVVAVAFLMPSSGAARPRSPVSAGAVIFQGGPGGGLYAADPRTGTLKHVLTTSVSGTRWSPDGRWLAFTRNEDDPNDYGLWVMRADGRDLSRLTTTRASGLTMLLSSGFAWSPDGRKIAFSVRTEARTGISTVDVRTRRVAPLTSAPANAEDVFPAFSPDGKRIAFGRTAPGTNQRDLWMMRADGRGQRRLTRGIAVFSPPRWSPDGKQLVFYPCCTEGVDLIGADGRGLHKLVDRGVFEASWSPNGRWIALNGSPWTTDDAIGTYLIRPNGKDLHKISDRGDWVSEPSWSPDSRWIAIEDRCCAPDIWAVAADGSGDVRLTEGSRYGYASYEPFWQPKPRPAATLAGAVVPQTIPTDTVVDGHTLRTRHPIVLLAADGPRAAIGYAVYSTMFVPQPPPANVVEVWNMESNALQRIVNVSALELAIAGERLAWHAGASSGMGVDSWFLATATLEAARGVNLSGFTCCSYPMDGLYGDGSLLVLGRWGACRISQHPPCATAPKTGGTLWRLDTQQATLIKSEPGALTPLAVEAGRILVDHEDGTLEILRDDGASLRTLTLPKDDVRGAKLQGRDLVVLGRDTLDDYDAATGALLHAWPLTGASPRLEDVWGGFASYVSGSSIVVVRLADGARRVIATGGTDVHTQLENDGLVYSFNVDDEVYPGRVVFVPFSALRVA